MGKISTFKVATHPMLSILDLSFAYEDVFVFHQLSRELFAGDVIHLLGENGAGKTTLLKLIAGLFQANGGCIKFNKPLSFQEKLALYTQNLGFHPLLTVGQNLEFFPVKLKLEQVYADLECLHLSHKQDVPFAHLSLGQQQKIALATLKHLDAALWLLDEPFANLDIHGANWLSAAIAYHAGKGGAVIFTAHQPQMQLETKTWQLS
jgi:heme exporter protein A